MTPPPTSDAISTTAPFARGRPSLAESHATVAVPATGAWRRFFAFIGPGYLVAVGYMDPGNWATDLAGGSAFGYTLLAVVLLSSLMAILLQTLSARLGIAAKLDLAQACRERYGRKTTIVLWLLCEVAIIACDLAEVLGTAIALKLLFGLPLLAGVLITAFDVLLLLSLQRFGFRKLEAFIATLLIVIAACFVYELWLARPDWAAVAGGLLPRAEIVTNPTMLYIAIGILGATVMPHNLYLHSSVVQTRRVAGDERGAIRLATLDTVVSLGLAFLINAAILILAASVFHTAGRTDVADIEQAHQLLSPMLGAGAASVVFALALLASGQNSTITGTLAGQIVMEGFLDLRLPVWLRRTVTRALTVLPAALVIAIAGEGATTSLLVLSQVVLSLQLPFAVVPLVSFTSDRRLMGDFASPWALRAAAWIVAAAIVVLNVKLLVDVIAA